MKAFLIPLALVLCLQADAAVNFDTLTPNTWVQVNTLYQYPAWGVETHLAFDTSGYFYMVGSCAYGGAAGGTHNNDIFRFNPKTGMTEKMLTCGTNPWPGGCQGGQVFDSKRNCLWFGPGANAVCRTGVTFFPGQAYYGGLYRMGCPTTPIAPAPPPLTVEKIRDEALGGNYYLYDPGNDLVIGVADNNYSGCRLSIYNIRTNAVTSSVAPFTNTTSGWRVPCCFDTKRGLVVIARFGDCAPVYFYNPATGAWSSKTPSTVPPIQSVPLVYEPVADKYVLIGTYPDGNSDEHPQVWAYDYDSNTWTQIPRGSRAYNPANRAASTWPPLRVYPGSFGYDVKNKVIVNWAGLPTNGGGMENGTKQPIWAFKLAGGGSKIEKAVMRAPGLSISASPNPFRSAVAFRFQGRGDLRIFSISGQEAAAFRNADGNTVTWNAGNSPAGVYLVELKIPGRILTAKVLRVE